MSTLTLNGLSPDTTALEADDALAFDVADPDDDEALDFATAAPTAVDDDEAFAPSMDLARLAGYDVSAEVQPLPTATVPDDEDSETTPVRTPLGAQASSAAEPDDLDADDVVDPRAVQTKHGFIGNPFTKLAVVGGGTLLVVTALGVFLSSVMGGHSNNAPVLTTSPSPSPSAAPVDTQSDEVAKFKTQSALSRQQELLNGAAKPQPLPTATAKPTPTVTPIPMPLSSPIAMPAAPAMSVVTSPVSLPTAVPVDPVEKWRMAATMGSYGTVPPGSSGASYAQPTGPVPVQTPAPFVPSVPAAPSGNAGAQPLSQLRASTSTPGLRDRALSPVLVGTTATAQTTTGVVMTGDNTTPASPDSPSAIKYLAQLKAGLNDANGAVALPAGATLVMVARSFSPQTGLAEFVVVSVLVDNKEYTVPKDTLVVRGADGGLVAFKKRSGSANGLFQSVLPAFFAGIGQASQVLNQPTSSSSVSNGSVSATSSSSQPNAAAGFAQGFGQNLSQALQQKAQAANQAAASAPVSWQLGAGTEVKVFVNTSFAL